MRRSRPPVRAAFDRLLTVRVLTFEAGSQATATTGWVGHARGTVIAERTAATILTFQETGTWTPAVGRPTTFHNVYRWTRSADDARLNLAHLRFGPDRPVDLFDLVPAGSATLTSAVPHACRDDRYAAELTWDQHAVRLTWTITGPVKAERVAYVYRSAPLADGR